jgi:hypothetical protein
LLIQHFVPFSTQVSPSRTARVRIDAASDPASRSDRAYENIASPAATGGSTWPFSPAEPASSSGVVPSLVTSGMSEDDAQALATSSMTIAPATASAPVPPYSSGMCTACRSALRSASYTSHGNSPVASTSAARGAILSAASCRTASLSSPCSSARRYAPNVGSTQ